MSLRQQPVVSIVSIIGTALAIFLIMLVVMIDQVKYEPFAPESNRDRWLLYEYGHLCSREYPDNHSSAGFGYNTVKSVFYKMETPEAVTAFKSSPSKASVSLPHKPAKGFNLLDTDDAFWHVFDFDFISGQPYTKEDFESGLKKAVISESVARSMYGNTDVVGQQLLINHARYTVVGVVEDVSNLSRSAYADIWVPFTSTVTVAESQVYGIMGSLSVVILAKDKADFAEIKAECYRLFKDYEKGFSEQGFFFKHDGQPNSQMEIAFGIEGADTYLKVIFKYKYIIFLILLIVPAVNLSSMTHSRLVRRREEIGVRRAFGATRGEIAINIFVECLVITLVAGLIGFVASLLCGIFCSGLIFDTPPSSNVSNTSNVTFVSLAQLFHWSTFALSLLFCFILNLLSAAIPTIGAARTNVVNAISGKG